MSRHLSAGSALLVSELTGFVCQQAMKTAMRENPNSLGHHAHEPSTWYGRSKQSCSFKEGWKARKIPAAEGIISS